MLTQKQIILRCMADGLSRTVAQVINETKVGYKAGTRICELAKDGFVGKVGTLPNPRSPEDFGIYKITPKGLLEVGKPKSFRGRFVKFFTHK